MLPEARATVPPMFLPVSRQGRLLGQGMGGGGGKVLPLLPCHGYRGAVCPLDLAIQAAKAKVIDLSEYIRSLVIEDLDRRRMLSYSP